MKLLLTREQASKGLVSKKIEFKLTARASLSDDEKSKIDRYKMGDLLLYTNLEDRGSGALGAISRAMSGVELRVNDLVHGKSVTCKDILEMMGIENQIRGACEQFKLMLDAASGFEGETVIEY
ncbi:MAG: hypothetical protein AAF465_10040 [Pseudomonadota bacterium]